VEAADLVAGSRVIPRQVAIKSLVGKALKAFRVITLTIRRLTYYTKRALIVALII